MDMTTLVLSQRYGEVDDIAACENFDSSANFCLTLYSPEANLPLLPSPELFQRQR